MTRRAVAGFARLLPLLLITAAVAIVVGAALLAACGGSPGGASSGDASPEPAATVTVTADPSSPSSPADSPSPSVSPSPAAMSLRAYFVRSGELGVAQRYVPRTSAVAAAALRQLLKGPSAAERRAGLSTTLATGIRINSLTIREGVAKVDLSARFWDSGPGLADARSLLPEAQIVYTLTQFPTVRRVVIRVDGAPYPASGSTGSPSTEWRRRDLSDFEPNIFVESPGVGALLPTPFMLTGTAMVFEGSFQARLVDSSGRRVVNVIVQATRGAPGRGRFAKEVAFSTSARRGTLIVFDQSMEDGSRQDEVRIPVTFAAD